MSRAKIRPTSSQGDPFLQQADRSQETPLPHIIPKDSAIRKILRGALSKDFESPAFVVRKILIPPDAYYHCYFKDGVIIGFSNEEFKEAVSVFRSLAFAKPTTKQNDRGERDKFELEKASYVTHLNLVWSQK
jgi:hypothetical protein